MNVLIEVSPGETRAALVDGDGRLAEFMVERMGRESLVGAIVLGRVVGVEKGLDAAFVEIGAARPGFLRRAPDVHEGAAVVVQVTRDATGEKGTGLAWRPTMVGRYLAITPGRDGVNWSRSIRGGRERERLEGEIEALVHEDEAIAVRAHAVSADRDMLAAEADRLRARWRDIESAATTAKPPATLLSAPGLIETLLRDRAGGAVVFDDRAALAKTETLVGEAMPDLAEHLELHTRSEPLFAAAGIEEQLEAALARVVELPGGGRLTFDRTEALTAIDVDAGGAGGRKSAEAAALAVNLEAAAEVARQIALRNIGGLIVVDFVSMRDKGNRRKLVEAVRRAFRGAAVTVDVLGMTAAGLVEITRRRSGPSLGEMLLQPDDRAPNPDPEATACAALRAALRQTGAGRPVLEASPRVIGALEGVLAPALAETNRRLGQALELRADPGHDRYRLKLERD